MSKLDLPHEICKNVCDQISKLKKNHMLDIQHILRIFCNVIYCI